MDDAQNQDIAAQQEAAAKHQDAAKAAPAPSMDEIKALVAAEVERAAGVLRSDVQRLVAEFANGMGEQIVAAVKAETGDLASIDMPAGLLGEVKGWVRREIEHVAQGLSHEERQAANP